MKKIIFLILVICSCSLNEFTEMSSVKVDSCTYNAQYVKIVFSQKMEKGLTEDAFSLYRDETEMTGKFSWNGREMYFYPEMGISEFYDYCVEIKTQAEDENGNSLDREFYYKFSTKSQWENLSISCVNIQNGTVISNLKEQIVINFSKSVVPESFYENFSLSPDIKTAVIWENENTQVVISLLENYRFDTVYTLSLSAGLKAIDGTDMYEDFCLVFATEKEKSQSLLEIKTQNGLY